MHAQAHQESEEWKGITKLTYSISKKEFSESKANDYRQIHRQIIQESSKTKANLIKTPRKWLLTKDKWYHQIHTQIIHKFSKTKGFSDPTNLQKQKLLRSYKFMKHKRQIQASHQKIIKTNGNTRELTAYPKAEADKTLDLFLEKRGAHLLSPLFIDNDEEWTATMRSRESHIF